MKPYCEVFVLRMLPTLRSALAQELTEKYGMSQTLAAKRLGVSQASISQYTRQLRGGKVLKNKDIRMAVSRLAEKISKKQVSYVQLINEFCKICKIMQKKRLLCAEHKKMYRKLECNLCKR